MPVIMDPALRNDIIESAVQASLTGNLSQLDVMISSKLNTFADKQIATLQIKTLSNLKIKATKNNSNTAEMFWKVSSSRQRLAVNTVTTVHITEVRAKIREDIDIVQHRQKRIKLADSSKHQWKVVEQYEAHRLANNSDTENAFM